MSETTLTKDAKRVLKAMYEEYLVKKNSGASRSVATRFDNPNFEGYSDVRLELKDAGYIETDVLGGAYLESSAIILFENMSKEKFLSFVDVVTKFIP